MEEPADTRGASQARETERASKGSFERSQEGGPYQVRPLPANGTADLAALTDMPSVGSRSRKPMVARLMSTVITVVSIAIGRPTWSH